MADENDSNLNKEFTDCQTHWITFKRFQIISVQRLVLVFAFQIIFYVPHVNSVHVRWAIKNLNHSFYYFICFETMKTPFLSKDENELNRYKTRKKSIKMHINCNWFKRSQMKEKKTQLNSKNILQKFETAAHTSFKWNKRRRTKYERCQEFGSFEHTFWPEVSSFKMWYFDLNCSACGFKFMKSRYFLTVFHFGFYFIRNENKNTSRNETASITENIVVFL